jgi:Phosphoesterase family
MDDAQQRAAHIKDATDFFNALDRGHLPAVAYVKPDSLVDGHPASSKLDLFEAMLEKILGKLEAKPELFAGPPSSSPSTKVADSGIRASCSRSISSATARAFR